MTMFRVSSLAACVAATLLSGCNSGNDSSSPAVGDYQYSTKAVYAARQAMNSYEVALKALVPSSPNWWHAMAPARCPAPNTMC